MRPIRSGGVPHVPQSAAVAFALLAAAGCAFGAPSSSAPASVSLHELDRRVSGAWKGVQRYRTIETLERLAVTGVWESAAPPAATDFILPDRKYRRPEAQTDPPGIEFLIVAATIYQRIDGAWSIVDPALVPADGAVARSLDQLRTAGLDGPPFRLPADVDGKLTPTEREILDGRPCQWFEGTANGPAGPVRLRVAIEDARDLPCMTEAEYDGPPGRARTSVRYFDYNGPIRIEPPVQAS